MIFQSTYQFCTLSRKDRQLNIYLSLFTPKNSARTDASPVKKVYIIKIEKNDFQPEPVSTAEPNFSAFCYPVNH